jgi:hypothetical protein
MAGRLGDVMDYTIQLKLPWVFGGWPGVGVVVAVAAAGLVLGGGPAREALSNFRPWRLGVMAAALGVVCLGLGVFFARAVGYQPDPGLWGPESVGRTLLGNFLATIALVACTVAAFLRLEYFSGKGWARRLAFGLGVCSACYLVAAAVYIFLVPVINA